MLAAYFADRYSKRVNRRVVGISPKGRACLVRYGWPGNVRELENAIERAIVLGSTELILPEDLPDSVLEETGGSGEPVTALHDGIREAKRKLIERAIEQNPRNEFFVLQQRGARQTVAHFFCGTTHIDVDDLRAGIHVAARHWDDVSNKRRPGPRRGR